MYARIIYLPVGILALFLAYTIFSQDLSIKETKEYNRQVVIYSTTYCSYCLQAKELLNHHNIAYSEIDITWDRELRQNLSIENQQATVPYVFINGKFIGGFTELKELSDTQQLSKLLK